MGMKILITGGAGFIGSALVRYIIRNTEWSVVNVDKLTYAANPAAVEEAAQDPRYCLEVADVCDAAALHRILAEHRPNGIIHLAAESHVDRSIDSPGDFIMTNVVGTYRLLEAARAYWNELEGAARNQFRFHHVSTDEVFGQLGFDDPAFTETTPYAPNSPYSASKAGSDHLVRAWHHTFGLPVVMSNCSNNYGPWQFPEKLIPLTIVRALRGDTLPVYGAGQNIRDWLHVDDHAAALWRVYSAGVVGDSYNIGGMAELANIEVVKLICSLLDAKAPRSQPRQLLIEFVPDRPGHDLRYAINTVKISKELGWRPGRTFAEGISDVIDWYIANEAWWDAILRERYDTRRIGMSQLKR